MLTPCDKLQYFPTPLAPNIERKHHVFLSRREEEELLSQVPEEEIGICTKYKILTNPQVIHTSSSHRGGSTSSDLPKNQVLT